MAEKQKWEMDTSHPAEYHFCEAKRGREFILRMTTGADPLLAIQQFAKEKKIRFGKIHSAFMGGFKPAKYLVWTPDTRDITNWHNESLATIDNLSMLLAVGGIIGVRINPQGEEESFVAMHFVSGGGWDVPTFGGHLVEGTKVRGVMEVFVTEILGIDVLRPTVEHSGEAAAYPENWYETIETE